MLGQHVECAGAVLHGVVVARCRGFQRRPAFQHLEAVGRHQERSRGLVEAMVGAADPLRQAVQEVNPDELTPKEALELLYRLKRL